MTSVRAAVIPKKIRTTSPDSQVANRDPHQRTPNDTPPHRRNRHHRRIARHVRWDSERPSHRRLVPITQGLVDPQRVRISDDVHHLGRPHGVDRSERHHHRHLLRNVADGLGDLDERSHKHRHRHRRLHRYHDHGSEHDISTNHHADCDHNHNADDDCPQYHDNNVVARYIRGDHEYHYDTDYVLVRRADYDLVVAAVDNWRRNYNHVTDLIGAARDLVDHADVTPTPADDVRGILGPPDDFDNAMRAYILERARYDSFHVPGYNVHAAAVRLIDAARNRSV